MLVKRAYKTELDPNNQQRALLLKHAGAARYAYNWGLAKKKAAMEAGEKLPTAIDLHKELNALKRTELSWLGELSKWAAQEALRNLDKAFNKWFAYRKALKAGGRPRKVGFPAFKSRSKRIGGFTLCKDITVSAGYIKLPRIGWLKLKERGYLPASVEGIRVLSATVSEKAGRWFVSVQVEEEMPDPPEPSNNPHVIGVDLGIRTLAVTSDGEEYENPKALKRARRKLRRLEKEKSRRIKGSANRSKTRRKLAKVHARTADIRKDSLHKLTTNLTRESQAGTVVVVEDLNVAGMLKNHSLAGAVSDSAFGEFRRQLEYKAAWYGTRVIVADRWFPSSKLHAGCGAINKGLTLSNRVWVCPHCGDRVDRDHNAALNLKRYGEQVLAGSSPESLNARGEGGAGRTEAVASSGETTLAEAGTERQPVLGTPDVPFG